MRIPQEGAPPQMYDVTPGAEEQVLGSEMDRAGYIIEVALFEAAMARQATIYATLAALADEYRTEVAADTTAYAVSAPLWAPRGVDVAALDGAELEALWAEEVRRQARLADVRQASLNRARAGGAQVLGVGIGGNDADRRGGDSSDGDGSGSDGGDATAGAVAAAAEAKARGNAHIAGGRYRLAVAAYTDGIDALRRAAAAASAAAAAAAAPPAPSSGSDVTALLAHPWVWLMCVATVVAMASISFVNPVLAVWASALGLSPVAVAGTFALIPAVYALTSAVAGLVLEVAGTRTVVVGGLALTAGGYGLLSGLPSAEAIAAAAADSSSSAAAAASVAGAAPRLLRALALIAAGSSLAFVPTLADVSAVTDVCVTGCGDAVSVLGSVTFAVGEVAGHLAGGGLCGGSGGVPAGARVWGGLVGGVALLLGIVHGLQVVARWAATRGGGDGSEGEGRAALDALGGAAGGTIERRPLLASRRKAAAGGGSNQV